MAGISREHLNRIESGKVSLTLEMKEKLLTALEKFNPDEPLFLLFDYVRIRFPTMDIKHIIKDVLRLNIQYMLHEDWAYFSYTEQYYIVDVFVYTSADEESMYKLSYIVRVCADDLDELKRRADEVKDFYDDLSVKLVRPAGDMLGLHSEFLPASKRYINDYVQYVKSDFLAGLGFGATQQLGENTGIYIGYSVDTGRNVYLQPSLASQGVKGTVTNALASAFIGSLGGGKSFCNNLLVYYSVLFGGQAVILDPKSERGNWKQTLPEIAHEINIVNLTSDKENAGLLDPFVIMKDVEDGATLAKEILTFLTGISTRDGEKFPVLIRAIKNVKDSEHRGLLNVIKELRKEETVIANNIADHIESFVDYDFAQLLFSDGSVENAISLDNQLNIIQVADLVLPDKDTSFEEYTTIELLSVAMLIVISTFALDFIHSDRSIFKIVDLDEAWAFLNVAQGETLSNKLVRAGRAMQSGVYFVTQSAYDVSKESLKNNIGLKFAFRSTDINEIKQTLELIKRTRTIRNAYVIWKTDNAYYRIYMAVSVWYRYTLFLKNCSMPLIQDLRFQETRWCDE